MITCKPFTINDNIGVDFTNTRFNQSGAVNDGGTRVKCDQIMTFAHKPMALTKSQCRRCILLFLKTGYSVHSERMSTAWVIVEYCGVKNIPFRVETKRIIRL